MILLATMQSCLIEMGDKILVLEEEGKQSSNNLPTILFSIFHC